MLQPTAEPVGTCILLTSLEMSNYYMNMFHMQNYQITHLCLLHCQSSASETYILLDSNSASLPFKFTLNRGIANTWSTFCQDFGLPF